MSKIVKLKQSDIERIVTNIVNENLDTHNQEVDEQVEDGMEVKLGKTQDGGYILYKTNPDGTDEILKRVEK